MKKNLILVILFIFISSISYVHAQRGFLFFDGSNLQKVVSTWNIDWGSGNVTTTGAFTGSSIIVSSATKAFVHLTNRLAFAPQNNPIFFIDDDSGNSIVKLYSETTRDLWLASTKAGGKVYTEDTFSCWTNNACDLGTNTQGWKDLYVVGTLNLPADSIDDNDIDNTTPADVMKVSIQIVLDGAGSAITTGTKKQIRVPVNMTIQNWEITSDQSGSIVIDIWKDTYANYPPTVADTIAGSEKPTLSAAQKNQDTNLTTWTTSVTAGDWIIPNVDSVSTVTEVVLTINGVKN
jgi:hypothetical protein